jgi:hypothetical protein
VGYTSPRRAISIHSRHPPRGHRQQRSIKFTSYCVLSNASPNPAVRRVDAAREVRYSAFGRRGNCDANTHPHPLRTCQSARPIIHSDVTVVAIAGRIGHRQPGMRCRICTVRVCCSFTTTANKARLPEANDCGCRSAPFQGSWLARENTAVGRGTPSPWESTRKLTRLHHAA